MIGPNISSRVTNKSWFLCPRISVLAWRGVYHDFIEERQSHSAFSLPDIIIGNKCSLGTNSPSLRSQCRLCSVLNLEKNT